MWHFSLIEKIARPSLVFVASAALLVGCSENANPTNTAKTETSGAMAQSTPPPVFSTPATPSDFPRVDMNSNGFIEKNEANYVPNFEFSSADKNRDGQLDWAEFQAGVGGNPVWEKGVDQKSASDGSNVVKSRPLS